MSSEEHDIKYAALLHVAFYITWQQKFALSVFILIFISTLIWVKLYLLQHK